jgi:hypothetical protein
MKIIFIHIPKTGGTTLKDILIRDYGEDNYYEDTSDFGVPDISSIDKQLISGHISFNYSLDSNILLTMLRNPIDRIISHYRHVLYNDHPSKQYAEKGLEYYATNPHHPQLDNGMIRQIINKMDLPVGSINRLHLNKAINKLSSFTSVGILEQFDDFIADLFLKGIIKSTDYDIKNRSDVDVSSVLTPMAEAAIINNNRFDIELYNIFRNKVVNT